MSSHYQSCHQTGRVRNQSDYQNYIKVKMLKCTDVFHDYIPVAIAYELTYTKNVEMATIITNFLRNHLYKSEFYHFYNSTINVPYPKTYDNYADYNYLLDYGEGQDYNNLVDNLVHLFDISQTHQEINATVSEALQYVYDVRNPRFLPAALIIIGESDEYVNSSETNYWLNFLRKQTNIIRMAVLFGGNLTALTSDPSKYYFKVDRNDVNSQQSIADKLAQLISAI